MATPVLSQEEIDALLTAVDKGDVDVALPETKQDEDDEDVIKSYDLTSQSMMLISDRFNALEEVYYKFANLLSNSLSAFLSKGVNVEFISTEVVEYGNFIKAFSAPTSFHIFNMDPLIGSSLIAVEPNLVFSFIDCMFGGDGKTVPKTREFTLIEQRMMIKMAMEMLRNLEQAWQVVCSIAISLKKSESKPEFVHLMAPNDLVISVEFTVKEASFSGSLNLGIAYLMLEPLKEQLSSRYMREKDIENKWTDQIQKALQDTNVNIMAELGKTVCTIQDILKFQVEDVIKLDNGPDDIITVKVEGVPKYQGFPGLVKGNNAVQITTLLD